MRYQDQVVKATQRALDDVCRAALAVPEDKRNWVPMGAARSVLDQMHEIASAAGWFTPIVASREMPDPDVIALARKAAATLDTVEKCVDHAREATSELCLAISDFPDAELEEEIQMPFGHGITMTMADVLMLHYANMVYHSGQINQIQLMLGDRLMH